MSWGKIGIFAGGILFGTAGIKLLSSKDAKKVYTHCTAAALRVKDAVVDQATIIQENCTDVYEAAKQINKERAEKEKDIVIDDIDVEESEDKTESETVIDGETAKA
ncbi:MAG: DUF6110 family protein [Lachnospiraceae bacterium]|nr:DUF6110 family protein [Lachnospiraceae bacterium]